jgi:hypothetical protein
MVFGDPFRGSNINKTDESITGGTNGIGAKLPNIFSDEYTVETVYKMPNNEYKYFSQTWYDSSERCTNPIIKTYSFAQWGIANKCGYNIGYTKISYKLKYKEEFGIIFGDEHYNLLSDIYRYRCVMGSSYLNYESANDYNVKVYYNNEFIKIKNMRDIALCIDKSSKIISKISITSFIKFYPQTIVTISYIRFFLNT